MKKLLMALAALAIAGAAAAGPNAGGTIIAHDASLAYSYDNTGYCGLGAAPTTCEGADVQLDGTALSVWKVYAAFVPGSSPRLKGMTFGVSYDADIFVLEGGDCAGFELPETGWPASGTGNSLVFDETQTGYLVECYWFGGYNYYGSPAMFSLGINPEQGGDFADDSVPSILDPIEGFGTLGFGMAGEAVCPAAPAEGACCLPDGTCVLTLPDQCAGEFVGGPCDPNPCEPIVGACCFGPDCVILTQADCEGQGGVYQGDGVSCDPNPCEVIPTLESSWGQIKNNYR